MNLLQTIGTNMRERRRELGISQDEAGKKLNTSRQYYGQIESGKFDFRVTTLERIANMLEIEIFELLNERE